MPSTEVRRKRVKNVLIIPRCASVRAADEDLLASLAFLGPEFSSQVWSIA